MTSARTRTVPTLAGMAVGAITLAGLTSVPGAAAAAAPRPATSVTASAGAAPVETARVANERQLRRAVMASNSGDGPDRIRLTSNVAFSRDGRRSGGALFGDLDVAADLRIVGSGRTIDANRVDRVLDVRDGVSLTVRNLTVREGRAPDGQSGGGVRSTGGDVILRDVSIVDSRVAGELASGGAVLNDGGSLVVDDARLARNSATRAGGAIEADAGTTVVSDSRLVRNRTGGGAGPGNGGGLHLTGDGTVSVERSRVAMNDATAEGGGLWNSATGDLVVVNSQVVLNSAAGADADQGGGGLYNDGGVVTITESSVNDNRATGAAGSGGGVLAVGAGDVRLDNTEVAGNTAVRAGGGIEVADGTVEVWMSDLVGNETGSAPGNGGGLHATAATSEVRVIGSRVADNTASSEGGGLWNPAGAVMEVRRSTFTGNVAEGAAADNGGGALFNDGGTLEVRGSIVDLNLATGTSGSGGGVLTDGGTLEIVRSKLTRNVAPRAGGAIEADGGDTTVRQSVLEDNRTEGNDSGTAPGNGGAVHLTGAGTVAVEGTDVLGNSAANEGGGLWNSSAGTFTVTDATVARNTASGPAADAGGGGLYNDGGALSVSGSTIDDNVADGEAGSGGGVLNVRGQLRMTDTTLDGNSAVRAGGGIESNVGNVVLIDVDTTDNDTGTDPGNGGGLHVTGATTLTWAGGTVTGNSAAFQGGGIWNSETGTITATGLTVEGNTAPEGPDTYNDGGTFTLNGQVVAPS